MSLYKRIRENWKEPALEYTEFLKHRMVEWRKDPATIRIERPTRLDRARAIGYRAKQGFILVRQRVMRGGRKKPKIRNGRRPKRFGRKKVLNESYQYVCELRAAKQFPNLEVINSYYVGQDGKYYWYEVFMVDKESPSIKNDKIMSWISTGKHRGRVFRGVTHSARKSQM